MVPILAGPGSVTWREEPVYRGSLGTGLLGTAAAALTQRRVSRGLGDPHFLFEPPWPGLGWTAATGSSVGVPPSPSAPRRERSVQ